MNTFKEEAIDKCLRDIFYKQYKKLITLQLQNGQYDPKFQELYDQNQEAIASLQPNIPEGYNSQGRSQKKHSDFFITFSPPYTDIELNSDKNYVKYLNYLTKLINSKLSTHKSLYFIEQRSETPDNYYGIHYHMYLNTPTPDTLYGIQSKVIKRAKTNELFNNPSNPIEIKFKVAHHPEQIINYVDTDKPSKKIDIQFRKKLNIEKIIFSHINITNGTTQEIQKETPNGTPS